MLGLGVGLAVLLVIALVLVGPMLIIWALNTLFGLKIAFTVATWFATLVLSATVYGSTTQSSSN